MQQHDRICSIRGWSSYHSKVFQNSTVSTFSKIMVVKETKCSSLSIDKKWFKVCHCPSSTRGPNLRKLEGNAPYETNLHHANMARTHIQKARFSWAQIIEGHHMCSLFFFLLLFSGRLYITKNVPCIQWLLVIDIPLINVSNLVNLWAHALKKISICHQQIWRMWKIEHFKVGSSGSLLEKIVEQRVIKNKVLYIHCK
jgi:hypothetical protein